MKTPELATKPHEADLRIINEAFRAHLRNLGYAGHTIAGYTRLLVLAAGELANRGQRLRELDASRVRLLEKKLWDPCTCRAALHCWLRFQGRPTTEARPAPWEHWVGDYLSFLALHRGAVAETCRIGGGHVRAFLRWRFRDSPALWQKVSIDDIRGYASCCATSLKPRYANQRLGCLRRFLRFIHLRGACPPQLAQAVPYLADFGQSVRPTVLSDKQRRRLIGSFPQQTPKGRRDYAIVLCLLELGLRSAEAVRLCLDDIDWTRMCLTVPAVKDAARRRELPLLPHVASALRNYIERARPPAANGHLFLRHTWLHGRPISVSIVRHIVREAFRRCGFPKRFGGAHRLRHTFATRLYGRGTDLKQLADLLGHRFVESSNIYAQTDVRSLRRLALPWPR